MLKIELNELSTEQVKQVNILRSMGIPENIIQLGIDNENKILKESKALEEKHFVVRGLEKIHNKTLCNEEEVFMNSKDISGEINGFISKITVEMNNNIEEAVVEIVRAYNPNNTTYEVNAKKIREALEKQILKKPCKDNDNGIYEKDCCPTCRRSLFPNDHHCRCGQAIDWSEEVEE